MERLAQEQKHLIQARVELILKQLQMIYKESLKTSPIGKFSKCIRLAIHVHTYKIWKSVSANIEQI